MFDEMDMLRNITKHLNEIVHTMEGVYIKEGEIKESKEEEEEEELPEDYEDMTSFLICCSQLRTQLENALREEKQILESLLKWFEKEVHEMEEIGEEEIIPDWQIPLADKSITNNINQLLNRIQRLEELKGRVQELPKLIQLSIPKQEKKKAVSPTPPTPKDPKNIIEELATRHATEDVLNMVQVFQEDSGQPQTIEMMNNRMIEIMKVFERQTNKLHRVVNEQDVLEGKLQKIQQEFRHLTEEKEIMEDELQKMKASEQDKGISETRKKVLPKLEKVKIEEKPQVPSEKAQVTQKPESGFAKEKEHIKMKDDLTKAQEDIQSLQEEKKMLEEKLQKALEFRAPGLLPIHSDCSKSVSFIASISLELRTSASLLNQSVYSFIGRTSERNQQQQRPAAAQLRRRELFCYQSWSEEPCGIRVPASQRRCEIASHL
ncbi:coiled-coil domain-containing protein 7 [Crotalus adamanteus]|uniref:Coiled-coil domain-containing protein 7 n=1 Tax=Crotalus adamanteus TaxID=8729 RepID=A0AAW1B2C2_CROAD